MRFGGEPQCNHSHTSQRGKQANRCRWYDLGSEEARKREREREREREKGGSRGARSKNQGGTGKREHCASGE